MATLLARLTIRDGGTERFEEICRDLFEASHAVEPELIRYEYLRSEDENVYYCFLSFADEAAFLDHQASDHHEAATAELRELIETGRFEWVDPVPGASPLSPTHAGGPREGAGETELLYHRIMGVALAEWWPAR